MFAVEMINITKRFARVIANDAVTFKVQRGTIHALVGENGAGKSTLMKILYGLYQPDDGEIRINEKPVVIDEPRKAILHGVGMVHQHFMLIPPFTVAENVVLGQEPHGAKSTTFGKLDIKRAEETVDQLSEKFGLTIDPRAKVETLSVGLQQRIEILKILYRGAEILILDEPSAVLTPQETDELFRIIRNLQQQGKTIILITHKLNEVMAASDRVSVMRYGKMVGEVETSKTTKEEIARMMVGREVFLQVQKAPCQRKNPILEVENLSALNDKGLPALKNVSFTVFAGEILGIAGVEGNGQTELVEVLTGLRRATGGHIKVAGKEITNLSPKEIFESKVSHIPEDRLKRGLVVDYSTADNLILGRHYEPRFANSFSIHRVAIDTNADALIQKFDIRPAGRNQLVRALSGGNQQKVIIARELSRDAEVLIASQPTRGVDIGAIEFIHQQIIAERDTGKAVLLVSADLSEVMSLSDRIAVMYEGKIIDIVDAETSNERELGLMMTGTSKSGGSESSMKDDKSVSIL